jgi:RHS repeat-associated protein
MATGLIRSAVYALGRATRRIVVFIALCVISAGVYAASCNPTTPRLDSGAGFAPFGENEQALARAGHSGPAWEWALGADTDSVQKVQGSLDWVSGKVYKWRLVNDGAGKEVLTIRNGGKVVLKLTYRSRMDAGNALELRISTSPSVGPGTTIAATLKRLNGHGVSGTLSQSGTGEHSMQALYYYYPEMANGFTATGTISLTYRRKPPSGSRVQFTVRAGTIACDPSGNPPTVAITAPLANSTFSAPATITLSADADDADGTVTQVAFYANGNLIGVTTSSPFGIQWVDVPPGAYNLTAVATDNGGLQATSTATSIMVIKLKALYFVQVDHLDTPRLIANAAGASVWQWDQQEPFGTNLPESNLYDSGDFKILLRFPGQQYDSETMLHYNYFRNYDPSFGRYSESDPIGLQGGINTFTYVEASPIGFSDPLGLLAPPVHLDVCLRALGMSGCSKRYSTAWMCVNADWTPSLAESQASYNAAAHGMRDELAPGRLRVHYGTDGYIESQIQSCTDRGLANALHAVQDTCAAGHRGGQYWGGGWPNLPHLLADWFPTRDDWLCAYRKSMEIIERFKARCEGCCS